MSVYRSTWLITAVQVLFADNLNWYVYSKSESVFQAAIHSGQSVHPEFRAFFIITIIIINIIIIPWYIIPEVVVISDMIWFTSNTT